MRKIGLPRVLIVGCGDIGLRILPLLRGELGADPLSNHSAGWRIFALTSQPERCAQLRAAGAVPLVADLDVPASLARFAGLARLVIYLAPPPATGVLDTRSRHLASVLGAGCRLVYISTTGVYGDCGGAEVSETRSVAPRNPRAVRRVDAEQVWRHWARRTGSSLTILRVPGIYAADRLPLERLNNGTPALLPEQDVYTNHIHAEDLARLVLHTLWQGAPNRVVHAVDNSDLKMGEYFDLVADHYQLPRPPRLSRSELAAQVSPMMLSFMSESRRLSNLRLRQELGFRLRYPRVVDAL